MNKKRVIGYIRRIFLNKYLLVLSFFAVWITFFDANSLIKRFSLAQSNAKTEKEILYYRTTLEADQAQIDKLKNNTEELEHFARETYLMKKPSEEVYIIK